MIGQTRRPPATHVRQTEWEEQVAKETVVKETAAEVEAWTC